MTTAPAAADPELTEFEVIDVASVKGVPTGANGFGHLIMKAVAASDTDAGVTADTGRPLPDGTGRAEAEPAHMPLTGKHMHLHPALGAADANGDGLHQHWHEHAGDADHDHAHDGNADHGTGDGDGDADDSWKALADAEGFDAQFVEDVEKAKLSAAERKNLPDSDFAIPETRDYPIHDENHARNALARVAQHGTPAEKRRVRAAVRKRYPGIEEDDASSKSVAEGEAGVDTDAQGTGSLSKAVEDAVTKALAPIRQELDSLRAFKAKVEAAPVPGGPVTSAVRAIGRGEGGDDYAAKAALYRSKADVATTPADAEGYRQLAREYDEKAARASTAPAPA